MKRFLWPALGGAVLVFGLSAPALAQTYPDDGSALQTIHDPYGNVLSIAGSLAPAGNAGTSGSGGRSTSLTGNLVTLNSGTVHDVSGALNFHDAGVTLSGNQVVIHGGTVGTTGTETSAGAFSWLKDSDTTVTGNKVTVTGGTINAYLNGGVARSDVSGNPAATNNSVDIQGGTFQNHGTNGVYGGDAHSYSGGNALASGNTVNISAGTLGLSVYGGYAYSDSGTATATGNAVNIGAGLPATAFNSANVWLYGGYTDALPGKATSTGNTLQIASAGLAVAGLDDFQVFDFILPAGLANNGTVLTVTKTATAGTSAVNAVVHVDASATTLQPGNKFILIGASGTGTVSGYVAAGSQSGTLKDSTGSRYDYTLGIDNNQLWLKIGSQRDVVVGAATPVPATSGTTLAVLGLCLAALAFAALRRRQGGGAQTFFR